MDQTIPPDAEHNGTRHSTPRTILEWHLAAGVDETIGDAPRNRYAEPPAPATHLASTPAPVSASVRPTPPAPARVLVSTDEAIREAVTLAEAATSLDQLKAALETFDGCPLKKTATNLVFGDGIADARIIFIGEAPGAEEDRQGVPFVGPSGQLLDKMLASIGLDRTNAFISNTVFWRPPGNRNPTTIEMATCLPFVERMIELIDPVVLVAVGGPAASALLAQGQSVGKVRGRWFTYSTPRMSRPIPATAIYHPAYLLRTPGQKRRAWQDLLQIKDKLQSAL